MTPQVPSIAGRNDMVSQVTSPFGISWDISTAPPRMVAPEGTGFALQGCPVVNSYKLKGVVGLYNLTTGR